MFFHSSSLMFYEIVEFVKSSVNSLLSIIDVTLISVAVLEELRTSCVFILSNYLVHCSVINTVSEIICLVCNWQFVTFYPRTFYIGRVLITVLPCVVTRIVIVIVINSFFIEVNPYSFKMYYFFPFCYHKDSFVLDVISLPHKIVSMPHESLLLVFLFAFTFYCDCA